MSWRSYFNDLAATLYFGWLAANASVLMSACPAYVRKPENLMKYKLYSDFQAAARNKSARVSHSRV